MRVHALDTAKGLGILLVVFGHAWRGGYGAGLNLPAPLFEAVDRTIYAFHMPLFFFLSGLLFWETLIKRRFDALLKERVVRLLWPMALWTWIFVGFKLLAGQAANQPVGLEDVQLFPLPPYEHMWFLWALFLIQIAVGAIYALAPWRAQLFRWGAAVLGVAFVLVLPFINFQSDWFAPALQHTPYFLIAIAFGTVVGKRPTVWMTLVAAVVFAGLLALAWQGQVDIAFSVGLVISLCVLIAYWDYVGAADTAARRALRAVGQASMAIYLSHTIFSAGLRVVMLKLGIDNSVVVLVATTLVGIVFPLMLYWISRRNRLGKLLGF